MQMLHVNMDETAFCLEKGEPTGNVDDDHEAIARISKVAVKVFVSGDERAVLLRCVVNTHSRICSSVFAMQLVEKVLRKSYL